MAVHVYNPTTYQVCHLPLESAGLLELREREKIGTTTVRVVRPGLSESTHHVLPEAMSNGIVIPLCQLLLGLLWGVKGRERVGVSDITWTACIMSHVS